ncbi:MAG: twin-arginine translocase TatA/TatE family subunit [Propionibacteriaceae bacterium]
MIAGIPGGAEWIVIVIALVLIFGGSRIAGIGKGTGRAIREFKEELHGKDATKPTSDAAKNEPELTEKP